MLKIETFNQYTWYIPIYMFKLNKQLDRRATHYFEQIRDNWNKFIIYVFGWLVVIAYRVARPASHYTLKDKRRMIIFCVCDAVLHAAGLRSSDVDYLDSERGNFRCSRASKRRLLLQRFRSSRLWSFFCQGFPQVTRFTIYFTSYNITRLASFVNYNDIDIFILRILPSIET